MGYEKRKSESNSTPAILTGIYFILLSLFNLCGSLAALGFGSLSALMNFSNDIVQSQVVTEEVSADDAEVVQEVTDALGAVAGVTGILGAIGLILAIAAFIVAIGLFRKSPWAYNGTLVVCGLMILYAVAGLLLGGGFLVAPSIVFAVIAGLIIYVFISHEETKQVFGRA